MEPDDSDDAETIAVCEAAATASVTVRCHPRKLAKYKCKARKLNMSTNELFHPGAELVLELSGKEVVRFAAARAAGHEVRHMADRQ
jgi:hypothetical protein